jgi:hypothetical protein
MCKSPKIKLYKIVILPPPRPMGVKLCLESEEHRLGVFKNRVLRRIFVLKREGWRNLHT